MIKSIYDNIVPYHNGVADGLAFSYKDGQKQGDKVQSLDIILKEIEEDVYNGFNVNYNYQLDYLAKQGVLLLNTILTVNRGNPLSHANIGWEYFTSKVILNLLIEASPKIFLLWGKEAQKSFKNVVDKYLYPKFMDNSIHLVLTAPHPAADLYKMNDFKEVKENYPNTFRGCKHFSKTNDFLKLNNRLVINWFDIDEPYLNKELIDWTEDLPF